MSSQSLPVALILLIIPDKREVRHHHCPLLGCHWSLQLLQMDVRHHRALTISLPPALTPTYSLIGTMTIEKQR